jgi:tetratricopeptide (TPR) repeat protein
MIKAIFADIEKYILVNLQKAEKEVKVAVCWLTNPHLFHALLECTKKGLSVEIILSDDRANFRNLGINFQTIIEVGGELRISRFPRLMHHKFCIIDQRLLFTGSYNWTRNAEHNNLENVILSTEKLLTDQFLQAFEDLKGVTEKVTSFSTIELHDYASNQEWERETEVTISTEATQQIEVAEPSPVVFAVPEISEDVKEIFERANLAYLTAKYANALQLSEKILETHPDIPDVWVLMSSVKWRQGKYKEQVELAERAKALDPNFIEAYNLLGIGYSHQSKITQSISHYETCLQSDPDDYAVLRNRALSYREVELNGTTPANIRKQYKEKADRDLKRVIELTNQYESEHLTDYRLYYIRGIAKYELNRLIQAKPDLDKAVQLYESCPANYRDVHELREIKAALRDIEAYKKTGG